MSCGLARRTLTTSESKHESIIGFTAIGAYTFDGEAVKIAGAWWVCGGRMGSYFCGYPYRPATAPGPGGGTTYKGPFTKEFLYEACADGPYLCKRSTQTYQPPRVYN
jgi:hypothetical protein